MRKTLFILVVLFFSVASVMAQQVGIEKSEEFDEPGVGWNKLLQLKNGNTFYFHSTKKEGIEVMVFDKKRKLISSKTLTSKLWDEGRMRSSLIKGLYEINGEPVIFLVQAEERAPTLYRMQLNGNTGAIVKEDEMGSLSKVGAFAGYAIAFGHVDPMDIIVEKDPQSDCYAICYFNSFAHNRNERIRVMHYDGSHKLINTAYYESPGGKFKYLSYIGMVVDGSKRVYVATYGHNGNSSDVAARIIVSRLNVGDSTFSHKLLNFSEDFNDTKSVMLYNHSTNAIQLLTLTYTKSKHGILTNRKESFYLTLLTYLNPETLELTGVKTLGGKKINAYGVKNIDKDYEFTGMPQQMIINKDNTTTILYEESETITVRSQHYSKEYTILGPIGVSELSDTGSELRGYAISKKQKADGVFPMLYVSRRSKGLFNHPDKSSGGNTNQFMSFDYINAPSGRYVVFNDLPGNMEKDEDEEKRKTVATISATNTVCYKLGDEKMDRFYLFGEPDGRKSATFSFIESSDYNKDVNTYATIIVERDGRSKSARVAWVGFQ